LSVNVFQLKRYFYLKNRKESLEKDYEEVKFAVEPRYSFFDKILCSCGAILTFPNDTLYSQITCDCGNIIELYTRTERGSECGLTFITARKTIYISDYALSLNVIPAENVVLLKGAYKRHKEYEKRMQIEKELDNLRKDLEELENQIYNVIERKEFEIYDTDLYTKRVIKCVRDDLRKVFLLSSENYLWKDTKAFIEYCLKELLWIFFEHRGYTIIWNTPKIDFSKYSNIQNDENNERTNSKTTHTPIT